MVSSIAAQYGFWHMGQFAADFKERFGVLPSELQKNTFPKK
jgi:AraC-like DNA-binding protein